MGVDLSSKERRVLALSFRDGPVTQARVAGHLAIAQQSASRILLRLTDLGLMRAGERVKHGPRGYPSTSFALVPHHALTAGFSVAAGSVAVLLSDFAGRAVAVRRVACPTIDLDRTLDLLADHVTAMRDTLAFKADLVGAGLAISGSFIRPGHFNTPYGMDQWANIDLEARFSDRFGVPVHADNDGNVAALAEALQGAGQRYASFAYLYIAAGVGGGLVLNRELWRGQHGNAGEFAGGLQPTLDVFPSLEVLRTELATDGHAFDSVDAMLAVFDPTWPAIARWVTKVSHSLSIIASNASAVLDLQAVVLGGRIPRQLAEAVIPHIRFFDQYRRQVARPTPIVLPAEAPAEAAAAGAAILPLQSRYHLG